MALCIACGNQVEESASFCTSCGKPMPAAAHLATAVSVARPVCSACGAQGDPGSAFCTECGKRLDVEPAPVEETASAAAAAVTPMTKGAPVVSAVDTPQAATPAATLPTALCTNCGSKLEPANEFCTGCGQPASSSSVTAAKVAASASAPDATQPVRDKSAARAATVESSRAEATKPGAASVEPSVDQNHLQPAPQVAAPVYAAPSDYPPAQPGGGAFRIIVLILLLVIVVCGFGGWYFMGVETVIVCSPPDVTVFLDDKELAPASYGRYVVPHLSRQPHLLKVQRAGFADTIERLDFPFTSLHEWINIKLVPHRQTRPSR